MRRRAERHLCIWRRPGGGALGPPPAVADGPGGDGFAGPGPLQSLRDVAGHARQADPRARPATAAALVAAIEAAAIDRAPAAVEAVGRRSRFWWEFHQGAAALSYVAMLVPAWFARSEIGGAEGRSFFLATASAAVVASMLRLHLWFTSHQHPAELAWARRRSAPWIRLADVLLVVSLVIGAGLVAAQSALDVVLLLLAIGAAVTFMLIEPATARAAGFTPFVGRGAAPDAPGGK
jgi:hypothetical protein